MRKRLRRTHYKAELPQIATCSTTGEKHLLHRAYMVEGAMYYRGQVLIAAPEEVAEASQEA
jgi:large subunit ribosomal protein L32